MEQEKPAITTSETAHMDHCFDYLRHGIMCAGDMTLENPDPVGEGLQSREDQRQTLSWSGSSWAGTKHVCNDWGEITTWQAGHFSPIY